MWMATTEHPRLSGPVWEKHMKRLRGLSEWQQALIDPDLVAEAISEDETKVVDFDRF